MYTKLPNLVIGFHGCDQSILEKVLYKHERLCGSKNPYDWLGNGMYFWEGNYQRAVEWAQTHRKTKNPAVIGAVIDLGNCLNLTDNKSIDIVKAGYKLLLEHCKTLSLDVPRNKNLKDNTDLLIRDLDCAVIETIHVYNATHNKEPYDSVRGVFVEGGEIYPNSGFRDKTHIQICVRNPNCIKGYFYPLTKDDDWDIP